MEAADDPYVLIVDDVEDNRDLYASYLEHAGFRVEQACDGEQALEKIAREAPAVVLMDLGMPNLDGWEATRLIKANPATSSIVVIVLTGFATREDLLRAKAAGADDIRTKPCLPHELLPLVRKHLASSRET